MAPVKTYVDPDAFKTSLRIPLLDTQDDADITLALNGASRAIDDVTGQKRFWKDDAPVTRTLPIAGKVFRDKDLGHILLTDGIASSVGLVVEHGSAMSTFQTLQTNQYELWPLNSDVDERPWFGINLPYGDWSPYRGMRARITAVWGWPSVPANISTACMILARRLFKRRESWSGIAGSQDWVVNLARTDPDVQFLLSKFDMPGFG